jgi:hypothetical protein
MKQGLAFGLQRDSRHRAATENTCFGRHRLSASCRSVVLNAQPSLRHRPYYLETTGWSVLWKWCSLRRVAEAVGLPKAHHRINRSGCKKRNNQKHRITVIYRCHFRARHLYFLPKRYRQAGRESLAEFQSGARSDPLPRYPRIRRTSVSTFSKARRIPRRYKVLCHTRQPAPAAPCQHNHCPVLSCYYRTKSPRSVAEY